MRISHFHPRAFSPAFTRVIAAVLCLAFLAPNAAFACIWDTDTMAGEADGRMDTLNAIVGNFDIYPARYYEMRIERVTRELAADPRQLELYDDIAVASDRVGRSTDAIEWMGRKREQLDALPKADAEAEYRYPRKPRHVPRPSLGWQRSQPRRPHRSRTRTRPDCPQPSN
jgi:hypothetical protein